MPTTTVSTPPATPLARSPLIDWLAVVSVMAGIFSIVTAEILPIGLLTSIGSSFAISDGAAGLMMTMPGIVAAIAAPTVTVATRRLDRRTMLCALVLLLAVANFLAAAATSYWVMAVSRVLVGLVIGGFWSIGAGLAVRLVRLERVGTATAVIFSAVPLGSVLGVPAGTLIGHLAGWRAAFVVLGVMSVAVFVALVALVPRLPADQVTRLSVVGGLFRSRGIRTAIVLTFLVVLAHFGAYTYVTPFLQQVTRVGPGQITTFLLVYGVAGIVGNFVGGFLVTRAVKATFAGCGLLISCSTLLLPLLGGGQAGALALLVVWGLAYGAVPVCSQTWFAASAPQATEASAILFTSSFQATIAIGALLGGIMVDAASPSAVMTAGGAVALLMAVTAIGGSAARR
ncbi:MFS transporter [Nonomuraea mangrovi]|uniref:MFS transporter n=1 Tax=Nonomuraea mangrovi TaxID=2316207 RepID=A0ABW4SRQ6_9ACTN